MQTRGWVGVALVPLAVALAALAGPSPAGKVTPATSPSPVASPAGTGSPAASPATGQLPLYTPIAVNEAVNVGRRFTMQLTDRGFVPSRFESAVNQDITVTLVNTGTRPHNFSIDELGVDVDVAPGQTVTVTIEAPPRLGHYTYYSDTPEDQALGMTGTMTIFI